MKRFRRDRPRSDALVFTASIEEYRLNVYLYWSASSMLPLGV